jgi:HAD superfamily hydrolase (TIGR01509 family)
VSRDEINGMRARRDARYLERLHRGVELLDGVAETLATLHGRVPMAIVTSSKRDHFDAIHAPLGVRAYFELVVASGDYEHGKPHPEPYLTAAKRLDVDPQRCLVVEDTERGLRAANRAGMACLVVPHELTRDSDFVGSRKVLGSVREVPVELERLNSGCRRRYRPSGREPITPSASSSESCSDDRPRIPPSTRSLS